MMIDIKLAHDPAGVEPFKSNREWMLLKTLYVDGYDYDEKEYTDCLYVIKKNVVTGEKIVNAYKNPSIPIYFEKEGYRSEHTTSITCAPEDHLIMKKVRYKEIPKVIADEWGDKGKALYDTIISSGEKRDLNQLLLYPYVFGADYNPADLYRIMWLQRYGVTNNTHFKLSLGFSDIETSLLNTNGECDPDHDCIDMVSIVNRETKEVHTFLYLFQPLLKINNEEEKSAEYRKNLYKSRIASERMVYENPESLTKFIYKELGDAYPDIRFYIHTYTNELEMLKAYCTYLEDADLDFNAWWNMSFDIPYIANRIKALGDDPRKLFCGNDFPIKKFYYNYDREHFEIKNNNDSLTATSRTINYCQMRLYAKVRKTDSDLRFLSLNYIANREGVSGKYEYTDYGNLLRLACMDYFKYIVYNIKDVLTQYDIDAVVNDFDNLQTTSYMSATDHNEVYKQLTQLRNNQYYYYWLQGLIPGVNVNMIKSQAHNAEERKKLIALGIKPDNKKQKKEVAYEGALVGNTKLIEHVGKTIMGKKSNFLFKYAADMDMKAFYPYTNVVNNIDKMTMHFKVIIPPTLFTPCGGDYKYHGITDTQLIETNKDSFRMGNDIAKEIFDNYITNNILAFGYKWLNLPSYDDLSLMIMEEIEDE